MRYTLKQVVNTTLTVLEVGYRIVRGIDYKTLSQYILKINKHRDIDAVLYEASRCLKEILDYELFGFSLKVGTSVGLWIDPRMSNNKFRDYIEQEHKGQNIDCTIHNFEKKSFENRQLSDEIDINNIISYDVIEGIPSARLYILPKRRMLYHHHSIINMIISSISIALEKNLSIQQLEKDAAIDPLTNCYNRRALDTFIENDVAYAQRFGKELSVIMLDLDNFKGINDTYGHPAGDAVLKEISTLIPSMVRKSDYLARFGGEEFVLVLPDSTLYNAVQVAHKLQKMFETHEVHYYGKKITLSASFGVASLEHKQDGGALLREADERLYKAKAIGKNNVVPSLLPCFGDKKFVTQKRAAAYAGTAPVTS